MPEIDLTETEYYGYTIIEWSERITLNMVIVTRLINGLTSIALGLA